MKLLSRVLRTIYEIRDLLSRRQWLVLLGFTFAQLLSSLLDLAAIALIGLISSLAASTVSLAQLGDRADAVIRILNLDSFDIRGQVLWLGSMVICALVLKSLLSMSLFKLNLNFLARISSQLSQKLIGSFFKMEISFINKKSAQEHIFALTSGVTVLIVGIIGPTVSAIGDLFLICIILIALFLADPGLTILVSLSLLATALLTLFAVQGKARHYGRRLSDLQVKSSEMIANGLLLFKIYVVRNAQAKIANNIAQLRRDYADVGARAKFLYSISKFVFEITSVLLIFLIGIYAFLSYDVVRGATLVVLFIAASGRVLPAIMRLQQTIVSLRASMSEAERTLNLIRELGEQETINKELNSPSMESQGLSFIPNLVLKDVSFYFKKNREILKNFSLEVSAGEVIAIAGSTGIGKTTLVDLILGLRKPIQGTVKISNLDPEEAFELFPGKVSYVPQDTHVFEGTFRENLVVGLDEKTLSDREIWLSVQRAELVGVVSNLEGELAARIGDRGNTLSGGQRQRIGIARAILSNPQILILDEATNSLDLGTEKKILSNLFQERKTCTGIIISHRLETLRFVDRVIFLESPGVVLQGSLSELTKRSKSFQKLIDKR